MDDPLVTEARCCCPEKGLPTDAEPRRTDEAGHSKPKFDVGETKQNLFFPFFWV